MKVIVASRATQGRRRDDFSWALDGEIVHLPVVECAASGDCGCRRSFVGAASRRATTTATVAERAVGEDDVLAVVLEGLVAAAVVDRTPAARQAGHWLAYALTADLLELAELTPVGTVVARDRDRFLLRDPD